MRRGAIVRVNLEDCHPPELGKTRPAVVLSNDLANSALPTVVVIPLSSRPPAIWPLRLALPRMPGLLPSFAVVPGIRQISKVRILEHLGDAPPAFMEELQGAAAAYLGD